jgi:uncharacterized protein (DUF608 family)
MGLTSERGLPLGGLGTGKLEFLPDLTLGELTIMNNWTFPLRNVNGFHVVLAEGEPLFLQLSPFKWVEEPPPARSVREVVVEALFPRVKYSFPGLPVDEVEVYSPLVPGSLKDSSLPLVFIRVRGEGKVAISFPNLVGSLRAGRANYALDGTLGGVLMYNERSLQWDPAYGQVFLGCQGCSSASYRFWVPGSRGMTEDVSIFRDIASGKVVNSPRRFTIPKFAREQIAGVVWKEVKGESTFVLAWYFNGRSHRYPYGHYYENWFSSALDVAEYGLANRERLYPRFQGGGWMEEAMLDSLYVLPNNSWFTKDGRFAVYETPFVAPLMNTIGSMTWDGLSFTLLNLFPDLVKRVDEKFGEMAAGGEIPHDWGEESIEDPIFGASHPYSWTDLGSTWVLMIYRDYLWTGDREFLSRNFGKTKEVVEWLMSRDLDGDCIPDSRGGFDNSYDGTHMYGLSPYVGTMFLASLRALLQSSEELGVRLEPKFQECLNRGMEALNGLWNGRYFSMWRKGEEVNDSCLNSQILGQFWCDALGLSPVVEEDKTLRTLRSIYELNFRSSRYCLTNAVRPDGSVDLSTGQTRSCWPRVTFAVAAHMYLKGMRGEAIEVAQREWETISSLNPWDQSSRIDAVEGKSVGLRYYIGSTSVWLLHMAIQGTLPLRLRKGRF